MQQESRPRAGSFFANKSSLFSVACRPGWLTSSTDKNKKIRSLATRPAATENGKRSLFREMRLGRRSALQCLDSAVAGDQKDVRAAACEQADLDHPDQQADLALQLRGIDDLQVVHVEDFIAVVGLETLPQDRLAPH